MKIVLKSFRLWLSFALTLKRLPFPCFRWQLNSPFLILHQHFVRMADAYLLLALTNSCKHNMRQHQLRVNPSLCKRGECQSHVLYSPQTKDTRYFLISRAVIAMVRRENMLMHFTAMFFSCSISAQWKAKQQSFFLEWSVSHINTPLLFPSEIPQKLFTSAFLCCCNWAVEKLSLWQWLKTKNNWFCLSKSSLRRGA